MKQKYKLCQNNCFQDLAFKKISHKMLTARIKEVTAICTDRPLYGIRLCKKFQ